MTLKLSSEGHIITNSISSFSHIKLFYFSVVILCMSGYTDFVEKLIFNGLIPKKVISHISDTCRVGGVPQEGDVFLLFRSPKSSFKYIL